MLKAKIVILMAIMSALFVGAVVFRVNEYEVANRESLVSSKMKSQTNAVSHAAAQEFQSLQRQIATLYELRKEKVNWIAMKPYDGLGQLSILQGVAQVQAFITSDKSTSSFVDTGSLSRMIGKIDALKVQKGVVYSRAFQDSEKNHHIALVAGTELRTFVFVGPGDNIQALVDAQKGSGTFAIVNSSGGVIAHTTADYVGKSMAEDPLFAEIRKTGSTYGFTSYSDRSGKPMFGLYQQIPNSDAYIMNSIPRIEVLSGQKDLLMQFVLLGAGFFVISAAMLLYVLRDSSDGGGVNKKGRKSIIPLPDDNKASSAWPDLPDQNKSVGKSNPAGLPNIATVTGAGNQSNSAMANLDRMKAYMKIASAVGHEIRGPLTGILGVAQNIKPGTDSVTSQKAIEKILHEARLARDMVDKLFAFAGEKSTEKIKSRMDIPLLSALKNLESKIDVKYVKVSKTIEGTSDMNIAVPLMTKALENILLNSIESMERMMKKELSINLTEKNGMVHLTIVDTGEGIEPNNIEKIYDPFYTSRAQTNHLGLGLPFALGVIREHFGQIKILSTVAKGTTVQIEIPLQEPKMTAFDENATMVLSNSNANIPVVPVGTQSHITAVSAVYPENKVDIPTQSIPIAKVEAVSEKIEIPKNLPNPGEPPVLNIPKDKSPLDFDVEHLFELPEATAEKTETTETTDEGTGTGTSVEEKEEALELPDGFAMSEATSSSLQQSKKEPSIEETFVLPVETTPEVSVTAAIEATANRKLVLEPPGFTPQKKISELDGFQVNIRRPGSRS